MKGFLRKEEINWIEQHRSIFDSGDLSKLIKNFYESGTLPVSSFSRIYFATCYLLGLKVNWLIYYGEGMGNYLAVLIGGEDLGINLEDVFLDSTEDENLDSKLIINTAKKYLLRDLSLPTELVNSIIPENLSTQWRE